MLTRLIRTASVVFAVSLFTFFLINTLPGSPINTILGASAGDAAARRQLTIQLGLNHPIYARYFIWLGHALHGNLGHSYISFQGVTSAILEHAPLTIELMILAEIISLAVSIPVAMYAALHPGGWFDRVLNGTSLALLALPPFLLGELLRYIFAVRFHFLPASGASTWFTIGKGFSPSIVATPQSLLMPAVTLAAGQIAVFARVLRGDLITTLKSEFITMARSKGHTRWYILRKHALRPSSFTLASLVGLSVGGLIAGAVIVEQIYALSGIGTLLIGSILDRDYLVVQGLVLVIATAIVTINFLTDAFYAILDPRIRRGNVAH